MPEVTCSHLNQINPSIASGPADVCPECVKTGDRWVHLRRCLVCGNVGCCDSSKNTHATKHFQESNHAIMQSAQPGEDWMWCYIDVAYVEPTT